MLTAMLGLDLRAARVTWTVLLVLGLIALAYEIRRALLIFILAVFLAYMINPLVELCKRYSPRWMSRNLAIAFVYLVLIGAIGGLGTLLGGRLVEEASNLAHKAPDLLKQQPLTAYHLPQWMEPIRLRVAGTIQERLNAGAGELLPLLRSAGLQIASLLGSVGFAVLVPILSFFLLKDGGALLQQFVEPMDHGQTRLTIVGILRDLDILLAKYIRALLLLSVAVFTAYFTFFNILGVPYAALLAAIAAPLEFIPVFGWISATVIILIVCGISGYTAVIWIIAFILIYRLFQDYVLQPYLMGSGVELHPLAIIFGVIAGEEIGGLWGVFLSVPVIAILRVILIRVSKLHPAQQ
jgi:predicted PurR-regulated permease PerM